jgi:hypothetical protein
MRGWGIYFDPVVDYIENAVAAAGECETWLGCWSMYIEIDIHPCGG